MSHPAAESLRIKWWIMEAHMRKGKLLGAHGYILDILPFN
jgi:hypothetical protein